MSSRFPDFDFAKLAKLHQLREAEIVRFNVPKIIAAVFAAGVLLFSRIPKEIIGRWFDYEQFQLFSFFGTIAVIGYLLLFFLPWWIKQERTKSAAAKVRHVLDYIAIQQAR